MSLRCDVLPPTVTLTLAGVPAPSHDRNRHRTNVGAHIRPGVEGPNQDDDVLGGRDVRALHLERHEEAGAVVGPGVEDPGVASDGAVGVRSGPSSDTGESPKRRRRRCAKQGR